MSERHSDPGNEPDPDLQAEGVIVGVMVGLAYLYGAYVLVSQLFMD
ncbi:hypothetical protein ACLBKU_07560 [Erythrobacter sp. NE805]